LLALLSVRVLVPILIRLPVPLMVLEMVIASLRLTVKLALLVMALLEEIEPVVLPAPIWRVPALIVVVPV
jgi:hypothetical protein